MTHIDADGYKRLAATSVAAFNSGTPLNDSLTKIATDQELNSDQIQRLVETTNQMAYLTKLAGEDDRTFEFKVANYDDIMDNFLPTEADAGMNKEASASVNPMELVTGSFQSIEKVAQDKEASMEKLGKNDKLKALRKVASHERVRLENLKAREHDDLVKIAGYRETLLRDNDLEAKLNNFDNGADMSKIIFGHVKEASDSTPLRVFSPDELFHVGEFSRDLELIKQAHTEAKVLETQVEEAEGILKEAFLVGAAIKVGKGVASAYKSPKNALVKAKQLGSKVKNAGGKALTVGETVMSTNEVGKNSKRNFDAWSSLRG